MLCSHRTDGDDEKKTEDAQLAAGSDHSGSECGAVFSRLCGVFDNHNRSFSDIYHIRSWEIMCLREVEKYESILPFPDRQLGA
jgi:hypothetical protein